MNKQWKKFEGKIVSITWLDACNLEVAFSALDNSGPSGGSLLAVNTTYGKIYKVYDDVIIILTEISTLSKPECIIIPISWITNIEENAKRRIVRKRKKKRKHKK